jgi:hypothetical protein
MIKVENSDIIKHVLSSLVDVTSTKTSKEHAWLTVKTLIKTLQEEHNFLKHIKIEDKKNLDSNLDAINVVNDINSIESIKIGYAIQNIIDVLKKYLGEKAGYNFTQEFRDDLGEYYCLIIKKMGVDLRLVEMQDEIYGWETKNYKIKDDSNVNIAFVEKKQ